jgi:hypothetical protein
MWFLERGHEAHEGGLDVAVLAREAPDDRTHLLAFGTGPRARQHGGKELALLLLVVLVDDVAEELDRLRGDRARRSPAVNGDQEPPLFGCEARGSVVRLLAKASVAWSR